MLVCNPYYSPSHLLVFTRNFSTHNYLSKGFIICVLQKKKLLVYQQFSHMDQFSFKIFFPISKCFQKKETDAQQNYRSFSRNNDAYFLQREPNRNEVTNKLLFFMRNDSSWVKLCLHKEDHDIELRLRIRLSRTDKLSFQRDSEIVSCESEKFRIESTPHTPIVQTI